MKPSALKKSKYSGNTEESKSPNILTEKENVIIFKEFNGPTTSIQNTNIIKKDQYSNESILNNLKKLFYCYAKNEQKDVISSHKFVKMVNDADIFYKDFDVRKLDIIFVKVNKKANNLNFDNFCEIILQIAEIKYPEEINKHTCVVNLLKDFIYPLLLKIHIADSSLGDIINSDKIIKELSNNGDITLIIKSNIDLFSSIYKNYFYQYQNLKIQDRTVKLSDKSTKKVDRNNMEHNLFEFLKDFEFQPRLISITKVGECYQKIVFIEDFKNCFAELNVENYGNKKFSFFHFLAIMVYIAKTIYNDKSNSKENYMMLFLEKIFLNPSSIAKKIQNKKNSYNSIILDNEKELANDVIRNITTTHFNIDKPKDKVKLSALTQETQINIKKEKSNMIFEVLDKYISDEEKQILIATFKYYCSLSDSNNYILMSLNSINRLIRDCGLIKLTEREKESDTTPFSEVDERLKVSYSEISNLISKVSYEKDHEIKKFKKSSTVIKTSSSHKVGTLITFRINFMDFVKLVVYLSEKICTKNENMEISEDFLDEMNCSKIQILIGNFINQFLIKIYENKVKNFLEKIENDYNLLSRIAENSIVESFSKKIKKILIKIFDVYEIHNCGMDFDTLILFCKDFEIFPSLIGKNQLFNYFNMLIEDFDHYVVLGNPNMYLNIDRFEIILFLISIDTSFANDYVHDHERIVMFFDKLSLSEGIKKLSQETFQTSNFNQLFNQLNKILFEYKEIFEQYNKEQHNVVEDKTINFKKLFLNDNKDNKDVSYTNQSNLKLEETKLDYDSEDLVNLDEDSNEFQYKTLIKKLREDREDITYFVGGRGRISIWLNDAQNLYLLEIKNAKENALREVGVFEEKENRIELHKQYILNEHEKFLRYDKIIGSTHLKIKNENVILYKERGQEWELEKADY